MSEDISLFARAGRYVEGLVLNVIARDSAQLAPDRFTRAAAKRLRAGIRAIEAYLRRLILLLALEIEHTLPRDKPWVERDAKRGRPVAKTENSEKEQPPARSAHPDHTSRSCGADGWAVRAARVDRRAHGNPQKSWDRKPSILKIFTGEHPFPDLIIRPHPELVEGSVATGAAPKHISAAPLLKRLSDLSNLAKDPIKRARRLAWTLARRRSGFLLAPLGHVPSRYGLEISALFTAMGAAIQARSRERPPPLGPKPRPPPRVRVL